MLNSSFLSFQNCRNLIRTSDRFAVPEFKTNFQTLFTNSIQFKFISILEHFVSMSPHLPSIFYPHSPKKNKHVNTRDFQYPSNYNRDVKNDLDR